MDDQVQVLLQNVDRTRAELEQLLSDPRPPYPALEPQLAKLRSLCQDVFFLNMQEAASKDVETRLWAEHQRVSNRFRSNLKTLRQEPKKVVERRKAEKLYLGFIKSSLRFYRIFVQRICSHFVGMTELYSIAQKMHFDLLSVDAPVEVDLAQRHQLLRSCHLALVRCGDLSRYRELELGQKTRDWGPAKGYYECAAQLDPTSGISFNQLATMALADEDHFRALYYNYRCLATAKPFPGADDNLVRLLKKIRTKGLGPSPVETKLSVAEIPYLKLHAMIYAGASLDSFQENRNTLMLKLDQVIASEPCGKSFKRMCLINIAAVHHAASNLQSAAAKATEVPAVERDIFYMLLELNISTFTVLLLRQLTELRTTSPAGTHRASTPAPFPELSATTRKLLPCLRLYSAWLLSSFALLRGLGEGGASRDLPLTAFWGTYGECLSNLGLYFPVSSITGIAYLLDEDNDMLHFTPFAADVGEVYLRDSSGVVKPARKPSDLTDASRLDLEMAYRIKGFIATAEYLKQRHGQNGVNDMPWLKTSDVDVGSNVSRSHQDPSGAQTGNKDSARAPLGLANGDLAYESFNIAPDAASPLEEMVDNLVGPEPSTSKRASRSHLSVDAGLGHDPGTENQPPTSWSPLPPPHSHSPQHCYITPSREQRNSFSLYHAPFAPAPGELDSASNSNHGTSSSRPGTSHSPSRLSPQRLPETSTSAMAFQESIAWRKKDVAERSSPLSSAFPSLSGVSNTPTGMTSFARGAHSRILSNDTFQSPLGAPASSFDADAMGEEVPRTVERAPLSTFGAIGDGRRGSDRGGHAR